MNYAAFLAVLVVLSFVLPLALRVLLWLNPTIVILVSIIVSVASVILFIRKHWYSSALPTESSQEFSSSLLASHSQEEDYHASL
jgi:hypothetical protein